MPQRYLRAVDPIVRHGLHELSLGLPAEHVLREIALMGALVGAGASSAQAIRRVEALEPRLLGLRPGEQREPYHGPYPGYPPSPGRPGMAPGGAGPYPYGKSGYAPGTAYPYPYGKPGMAPTGMPAAQAGWYSPTMMPGTPEY